jgi:hypothetical protein
VNHRSVEEVWPPIFVVVDRILSLVAAFKQIEPAVVRRPFTADGSDDGMSYR